MWFEHNSYLFHIANLLHSFLFGDWKGRRPPDDTDNSFLYGARMPSHGVSMHSILETKTFFRGGANGTGSKARIRYYMSYSWSPWNVEHMEDCHVIVMNFGLHYNSFGEHHGKESKSRLMDDMQAAITYLSNFTASKDNRIAVWRSALPQHFDTRDGHFLSWNKLKKDHTCVPNKGDSTLKQQVYNGVYDQAFAKLCQPKNELDEARVPCNHLSFNCTVKPTGEVEYQTIWNFWRANNSTERILREKQRLSNLGGNKESHAEVTGTILRWNVFDIFDVEWWHSKDMDCSHYGYIPPLFEAAFERLELLISPLLASF